MWDKESEPIHKFCTYTEFRATFQATQEDLCINEYLVKQYWHFELSPKEYSIMNSVYTVNISTLV